MRLSVLGTFQVRGQRGPIEISAPKQRAILAFLAANPGRVVSADRIIDAIWGDQPPSGGRKTLFFHVSKLRSTIRDGGGDEGRLETSPGGYQLSVSADELDSIRFDDLYDEAVQLVRSDLTRAGAVAEQALDLWSDQEPYADLRYEEFLQAEIQRLIDRKLACIEIFTRAGLFDGQPGRALEAIPTVLPLSPYREALHSLYMQALAASGRRTEAIRHYDSYVSTLAEETGNTPQAEIQELAIRLLADESPEPVLRPSNLPAPITPLVGRARDLERLTSLIGANRYLDVLGPGGIGKSRLAIEAVRSVVAESGSAAWFIDLTRAQHSVIGALADTLGLKDRPDEDLETVVTRAVGDRDSIFLFDNCETLAEGVSSLARALLAGCPNARVVTTSRLATDETIATAFRLVPMGFEDIEDGAVELFVNRAAAATGSSLGEGGRESALQIVRRLDGMPLAIELAASQLSSRSVDDLRQSLEVGGVRALDQSLSQADEGPIWRMLRDSVGLLDEIDRETLLQVSSFSGPFTAADAAGLSTTPPNRIDGRLHRLANGSLLVARTESSPTRFVLLDTVKEYLQHTEASAAELTTIEGMHLAWCEDVSRTCRRSLLSDPDVLEWTSARLANLRSAFSRLAVAGEAETLVHLLARLDLFWVISGRAAEGLGHLEMARAAGELSPAAMAVASSSEGLLASIDRKYDRAEAHFQTALDLGEHAPFVVPLVFANRARSRTAQAFSGVAENRTATLDAAGEDFEVAIAFFEATNVAAGLVTTLPFAAWHSILGGDDRNAERYLDRTLQIAEDLGYGWPAAVARSIEGLLRLTRRQPERAEEDLDDAEEGLEKWGDRYSMQITESFRAAALLQQGRIENAIDAMVHALTLMESQGSREWEAMTTGIALAVMADADVSDGVTGRCLGWLEAKHPSWRDIVSTVGVTIPELEPIAEVAADWSPASEIARYCRTELQATASSRVD